VNHFKERREEFIYFINSDSLNVFLIHEKDEKGAFYRFSE